jgi:hypothetical protein
MFFQIKKKHFKKQVVKQKQTFDLFNRIKL